MNPNFHTFQNVQGMLLVTDKNSKVIWINNECRETLGFIEKNLVGKRLYDICLDSTKLQKAFDELSPNTAKNLYTEFKFDGKSGNNILVVNLFLKNFKLNNKQYISVMLFIPERHNPLRIIYRYIVDASCLAYLILDEHNRILDFNYRLLEYLILTNTYMGDKKWLNLRKQYKFNYSS